MAPDPELAPSTDAPEPAVVGGGDDLVERSLHDELEAAFEAGEGTDEVRDAPADARARDPLGRFAPAKAAGGPQDATKAPASTVTPIQGRQGPAGAPAATEPLKAPASWTPSAREKWQALPPEVQAEVHRREGEMGRVLQETAGVRQFADAFQKVVSPYEMFIRAENSSPLAAVDSLMRTAAELRVGTAGSKANLVAQIIKTHGVDVDMLDTLLANAPEISQLQGQGQGQQFRDPRFDQFLAQQQTYLKQQAAFEDQQMRQGLNAFAASHEFYSDVAALMADLVEVKAKQGQPIDMEKIYAQACSLNEDVSSILRQRQPAANAVNGARSQAVLRARRAAVSVKGDSTPHGATMPADDSIRATLEAAFDQTDRI